MRVQESASVLDFLDCNGSPRTSFNVDQAMQTIAAAGSGVIVLLRRPDNGRTCSPRCAEPSATRPVAKWDPRTYGIGAQILLDLGVGKMRLMSSPRKMPSATGFGLRSSAALAPDVMRVNSAPGLEDNVIPAKAGPRLVGDSRLRGNGDGRRNFLGYQMSSSQQIKISNPAGGRRPARRRRHEPLQPGTSAKACTRPASPNLQPRRGAGRHHRRQRVARWKFRWCCKPWRRAASTMRWSPSAA